MAVYRIVLDVYNSRSTFKSLRVSLDVTGYSPSDARSKVRTVYVSADRSVVTLTGGVGFGGSHYPEWEVVSTRKVPRKRAHRVLAVAV